MLYTKAAKVIAGLGLAIGVFSFLIGLAAILGVADPEISRRAGISGKTIDFGAYCIFASVVLGVLAELSQSLAEIARTNK